MKNKEGRAVDDNLAGHELPIADHEMLGNLDLLAAVAGGVELEGILAIVGLRDKGRDCLFRPTVGLTVCTSNTRWSPEPTAMTQVPVKGAKLRARAV